MVDAVIWFREGLRKTRAELATMLAVSGRYGRLQSRASSCELAAISITLGNTLWAYSVHCMIVASTDVQEQEVSPSEYGPGSSEHYDASSPGGEELHRVDDTGICPPSHEMLVYRLARLSQ